jgi:hypothetical protein
MPSVEELMGFDEPEISPAERRRERRAAALDRLIARGRKTEEAYDNPDLNIQAVYSGVTVGWLSQVFHIDPTTVKRRLKDCPALHRRKNGFVYDLKVAAPYLLKPVFDVREYIKTMKPEELPTKLQDQYWSAMNKKLKWEERAGNLWRSEKVLQVFGEVFQTIKFSLQLWTDNLERATGLTSAQRTLLSGMVDGLQDEIYTKLQAVSAKGKTGSVSAEEEADEDV